MVGGMKHNLDSTSKQNARGQADPAAQILAVLQSQFPGQAALNRNQTAKACGYNHPITIDRARAAGLIHPSVATRRPTYPLPEIARFLASTVS